MFWRLSHYLAMVSFVLRGMRLRLGKNAIVSSALIVFDAGGHASLT